MSRSVRVQPTKRVTIESIRSFRATMDAMLIEINFFNPLHSDQMVDEAVAANDYRVFDAHVAAASGPRGMGYLSVLKILAPFPH